MRNKNWDRWIVGSCAKFFDDRRNSYTMFVEGDIRTTEKLSQWAEFRLDGPYCQEVSKDCWKIDIEVNILCLFVPNHTNTYGLRSIIGHFSSIFDCFPVYRFGNASDDPENDGTLLGIMRLLSNNKEQIRVSHFGGVTLEGASIQQACVEGHFRMDLDI